MRKCADNGRKNVFQDQEVIVFNSQIKMQIFYSCRNEYIPMHVCDRAEMFIVLSVRYLCSVRSLVACFGSKISICKKKQKMHHVYDGSFRRSTNCWYGRHLRLELWNTFRRAAMGQITVELQVPKVVPALIVFADIGPS